MGKVAQFTPLSLKKPSSLPSRTSRFPHSQTRLRCFLRLSPATVPDPEPSKGAFVLPNTFVLYYSFDWECRMFSSLNYSSPARFVWITLATRKENSASDFKSRFPSFSLFSISIFTKRNWEVESAIVRVNPRFALLTNSKSLTKCVLLKQLVAGCSWPPDGRTYKWKYLINRQTIAKVIIAENQCKCLHSFVANPNYWIL